MGSIVVIPSTVPTIREVHDDIVFIVNSGKWLTSIGIPVLVSARFLNIASSLTDSERITIEVEPCSLVGFYKGAQTEKLVLRFTVNRSLLFSALLQYVTST